jgi:FAD/FMN-containing dehydrogenase
MGIVQGVLHHVPGWLLGTLAVVLSVGIALAGTALARAIVPAHLSRVANDVSAAIFSVVGVVYAVLLAFVVIATWENYEQARRNVVREANNIADLHRDATPFNVEFREGLDADLREYVAAISEDEWELQNLGVRSARTQAAQERLWRRYAGFEPRNETEKAFYSESLTKLNDAAELRRQRLVDATTGIHPILYLVLFVGGAATLVSALAFKTESAHAHFVPLAILGTLVGLTLFTIMAMDYPFTGSLCVEPDEFRSVLATLLTQ